MQMCFLTLIPSGSHLTRSETQPSSKANLFSRSCSGSASCVSKRAPRSGRAASSSSDCWGTWEHTQLCLNCCRSLMKRLGSCTATTSLHVRLMGFNTSSSLPCCYAVPVWQPSWDYRGAWFPVGTSADLSSSYTQSTDLPSSQLQSQSPLRCELIPTGWPAEGCSS